jgi:hypothetical protein
MNTFRRGEPDRYRGMSVVMWERIRALEPDPLRLLLHLWFGPLSTGCGIILAPQAYLSGDFNWKPGRVRTAEAILERADLLWRDKNIVVLPDFLNSNVPSNPNLVKSFGCGSFRTGPLSRNSAGLASAPRHANAAFSRLMLLPVG